uniref:Uncharacterized protein n=1 Tax=Rhizophora mucronata TaxID=61149 RepID=A0A2P2PMT4_RHIMU
MYDIINSQIWPHDLWVASMF